MIFVCHILMRTKMKQLSLFWFPYSADTQRFMPRKLRFYSAFKMENIFAAFRRHDAVDKANSVKLKHVFVSSFRVLFLKLCQMVLAWRIPTNVLLLF